MTASIIPLRVGGRSPRISSCAGCLLIVLLCIGPMLGGCAVDLPFRKDKRAVEEGASKAVTQKTQREAEPLVYYVSAESLGLYEQPGTARNLVAVLEQYQKVYRYKIEKGFAWVKVDGSDMTGWVKNAKLIHQLPQRSVGEPAKHSPATSNSPSDEEMEKRIPEGETQPTASPESAPKSVDPSAFDAF